MNKDGCIIRLEKADEYRKVETLVREAFWNVYRPGCTEHYLLHKLRNDSHSFRSLILLWNWTENLSVKMFS